MKIELRHVVLPDFGVPVEQPSIPSAEYEARARAVVDAVGLDWVAVYGDREHFANVMWLTGYDPRFEETLLLLGRDGTRALLVGIEGVAYGKIAGLPLDLHFYHPFSILGQPNEESPPLKDLLPRIGIGRGASVGIVGWKTPDAREVDDVTAPCFVPAFLVQAIDGVTGTRSVDVTSHLIDPERGLRTRNSAAQIASLEWGAARASAAILRVVRGVRPGMTEFEAAGLMTYQGEPCTMHPIVSSTRGDLNGLRSPSARVIEEGDAITSGVGFWGGLTCRAGIVAKEPDQEFFGNLIEPYFRAIATWWSTIAIDLTGGEMEAAIRRAIGDAPFRPFVNPGHLTSYDEWVHSPVREGSAQRFASGMMLQCDIIPTPMPIGQALNCEDTLALADASLREELARDYPALWKRIEARRTFMSSDLGIQLHLEVLPLSTMPAYLPPAWLTSDRVCVVAG